MDLQFTVNHIQVMLIKVSTSSWEKLLSGALFYHLSFISDLDEGKIAMSADETKVEEVANSLDETEKTLKDLDRVM